MTASGLYNLNVAIFVVICGCGIASDSSIYTIDIEMEELSKNKDEKPSLYEYFGGLNPQENITSGLIAEDPDDFELNGKRMKILGGSMHYFRVHPQYWRDRLRKYRAAGLNSISVYIPWNLHEPERGVFDFGDGGRDFSPFLNLTRFLEMAKEEDLFVVFRPGPYICGEWEFGGLPSWLLSQHPMFVRTSYEKYEERVNLFFKEVLSRVKDLQFYTSNGPKGGPIIAVQIENEYGSFGYDDYPRDKTHLHHIKVMLDDGGIESLYFTSDNPKNNKDYGTTDSVLMTANFKFGGGKELDALRALQPNKPLHVTEFWPGWFDHWFEPFHTILSLKDFNDILDLIFSRKASVNFYMFHGGTNWGFMNGANVLDTLPFYAPDVASYDYDAPLSECGNYTEKYFSTILKISEYDPISSIIKHPDPPEIVAPIKYNDVVITEQMDFEDILNNVPQENRGQSETPISMEQLEFINGGNGQSYGYIVYRKKIQNLKSGSMLKIRGHVHDLLSAMVNGVMIHDPILTIADTLDKFGSWGPIDSTLEIDLSMVPDCKSSDGSDYECVLDLMVENMGRNNFGKPHQFDQKKGLWEGPILLDDVPLLDWEIIPLEFKGDWVSSLTNWRSYQPDALDIYSPKMFKGILNVNTETVTAKKDAYKMTGHGYDLMESYPRDTFFDFSCGIREDCRWMHGSLFINGFNVGRYHKVGPQQTLYIPGPLLRPGENEIIVMENYRGNNLVQFSALPNYGVVSPIREEEEKI